MNKTAGQPEAVINEKKLIEAIFTYASTGILVVNNEGEIILANPFLSKLFGYSTEEISGKKIELLIPSKFHRKHVHKRQKFNENPQNRPMGLGLDLFGLRKDGTEFPVEISLGHYHDSRNNFVVAFVNDITRRKKADEEIARLNDELEYKVEERTHRLKKTMQQLEHSKEELALALDTEKDLSELKSRFVSIASHEFRTPLSTVLSSAYLLRKYTESEEQPKRQKHIERIISAVNMLTDILNDLLSVGKIEEGKIAVKRSEFNVKEYVTETINEIRDIQKAGQKIFYTHTGEEMFTIDASLLKHILINLLSNAIKFSPENSVIEIKSSNADHQLTLSVKDNGIGISKEDQKHLFERFFRGTNAANIQGTGLGLHIVAKYAELIKGKVECKSELEKGSEFIIKFVTANKESETVSRIG